MLAENGISMIADKVNQAPNVIIAEIKKAMGGGREGIEKVVRIENRACYCKLRHFIKQIKRFNDVCAHRRSCVQFQFNLTYLLIIEINLK